MSFSDADRRFQQEVRTWLADAWPEEVRKRQARSALGRLSKEDHVRWQQALAAKGWAAVDWPKEHGGAEFTPTQNYIFDLERARVGAPAVMPFGMTMVAPVIMKFGTEEQKRRFLPDILNTNVWWCQGYSEPGSGSDLASLRTKAEDKGDHFLVNGVKTWTTLAQYADWIFCLVRTSQEAKQQMGISFLLIDMHTPGVTVNPIVTLDQPPAGHQEINMVYFENVVVPKQNLVGEVGKGWTCAKYLLEFERGNAYSPTLKGVLAQIRAMAAAETDGYGSALIADAAFKARVDDIEVQVLAMEFTELRILGALAAGQNVGTGVFALENARNRTAAGNHRACARSVGLLRKPVRCIHADGRRQLSARGTRPRQRRYAGLLQYAQGLDLRRINEIQRNIMSKLVLGLG